jgi:hypothetical protein
MRILIFACISAILLAACQTGTDKDAKLLKGSPMPSLANSGNAPADSSGFTTVSWLDQDLDFGKVSEGQKVEVAYRFKNTGTKPLIIYSVKPGCGCTVAEPPKEPVLPGKEGVIKGAFDSNGRSGMNNKSIFVTANTFGGVNHTLHFKVEVAKKQG